MIHKDIIRHGKEFQRALQQHQWENSDNGAILFPKMGAMIQGRYDYFSNEGERHESAHNLVPVAGLNYLLEAALRGGTSYSQFYLALFDGAYTPNPDLKAADFAVSSGELVSSSEGYSESTRPLWQAGAADSGTMNNDANRATFTIVTSGQITIRGAALLSDSTKGGTSGILLSIARFPNDRVEHNGDVFNLAYSVDVVSP